MLLQWAVPAVTGALVVISAFAGEQERASEVQKGVVGAHRRVARGDSRSCRRRTVAGVCFECVPRPRRAGGGAQHADRRSDHTWRALAESLAEIEGVTETIDQIVSFAVQEIDTAYGGITLVKSAGRAYTTVGATHQSVIEADRIQYELRQGPVRRCRSRALKIVVSSYLATDERWPDWGPKAGALGFNSVLSAELHARGRRIGALNLYGTSEAHVHALRTSRWRRCSPARGRLRWGMPGARRACARRSRRVR